MRKLKITGTGISLPKTKVTSTQLEVKLGLKAGSIERKVGVETRYFLEEEESGIDLAVNAVTQALEAADLKAKDLCAIVSASGSFFQTLPSNASLIHSRMNLPPKTLAFDMDSTCLSFLTALDMVSYALAAGRFKHVAIVSSEMPSKIINWNDEETATLFGDGASAVIVSSTDTGSSKILASHMMIYSEGIDFCKVVGGGSELPTKEYQETNKHQFCFEMDGPKVFRVASKHFTPFVSGLLDPIKYAVTDLDMVIPHQASLMAVKLLQKKINVHNDKIIITLPKYGNTVAASIPMALHEAISSNRIQRGNKIMFIGTSAGLSLGGMVIEY